MKQADKKPPKQMGFLLPHLTTMKMPTSAELLNERANLAYKYRDRRVIVFFDKTLSTWRAICLDGYLLARGFTKAQAFFTLAGKIDLDIQTKGAVKLPSMPPPIFYAMYFQIKAFQFFKNCLTGVFLK